MKTLVELKDIIMGKNIEAEKGYNIVQDAVLVNKWAQRLMHTLQLEGSSQVNKEEVHKRLVKARLHLESAVSQVDYDLHN